MTDNRSHAHTPRHQENTPLGIGLGGRAVSYLLHSPSALSFLNLGGVLYSLFLRDDVCCFVGEIEVEYICVWAQFFLLVYFAKFRASFSDHFSFSTAVTHSVDLHSLCR